MTRLKLLSAITAVLILACGGEAVPVPKKPQTVISVENAEKVRAVGELPKRAHKIRPGPKPGELILLDWDNSVEVVDDVTFRPVRTHLKDRKPTDFAVSRDGKLMAWTGRDRKSYTIQETAGEKSFKIEPGHDAGYASFSPDGKLVALGSTFWDPKAEGAGYSEVKLYDLSGKLVRTLDKTGPGAVHPVFSPDGKTLAVGNRNYETCLYDVATGKLLHKIERRMIQEVAFSPDGKKLAAGYVDGLVGVYDVATGKSLAEAASGCEEIYSVAWSPKGDVLASSGLQGPVVLWEPRELKKLKVLDAPFWVIQVRFTADGTRVLTSSSSDHSAKGDRKITIWSVPDPADK